MSKRIVALAVSQPLGGADDDKKVISRISNTYHNTNKLLPSLFPALVAKLNRNKKEILFGAILVLCLRFLGCLHDLVDATTTTVTPAPSNALRLQRLSLRVNIPAESSSMRTSSDAFTGNSSTIQPPTTAPDNPDSIVPNPSPTASAGEDSAKISTIGSFAERSGVWVKIKTISELRNYECVGWRRTGQCSPDGPPIPRISRSCSRKIRHTASGYCEIKHKTTGEIRHVLPMHCYSRRAQPSFSCDQFVKLIEYNLMALEYKPKVPLSFDRCQQELLEENGLPVHDAIEGAQMDDQDNTETNTETEAPGQVDFTRGIAIVVYDELLLSAYASIRWLREDLRSNLPVEMWYVNKETNASNPVLTELTAHYGVFLRSVKDPRATKFYTKIYAVFYSAFDHVLLLDADNFAVRDPTYLFSTSQYIETGAVFWPDFWRPNRTIFGMTSRSFVWEFFGIPFVDMFEQESGQVLINRRRHVRALHALLHYGLTEPHTPQVMSLTWGDKDLFRFAWMRTNSAFHMIERPAGSAGVMAFSSPRVHEPDLFCGQTMVQHDPNGSIIFLHRNIQKLTATNHTKTWTHVQQYKTGHHLGRYDVVGVVDKDRFPLVRKCYGKYANFTAGYAITPITDFAFGHIEDQLLTYVSVAAAIGHAAATAQSSPTTASPMAPPAIEPLGTEPELHADGETEVL
ncbi:TPA: hypothetical protein N0F65_007543 [Lagenidium giganteum]|uniref:Uncharacterized protein n=1 Tax=Lagenidium giganteum TaxID=4803 RepID=A0AAV2ZD06_9STRA|nr:TPA: hypothetical protein N0F65_007543 [Lagenidium giganteum]